MAIGIRSITTALESGASGTISVTTSESPSATAIGDVVVVIHCNDFYALSNMPTPTATGSPTLTGITNGIADAGSSQGHAKSYTYVVNTAGAQVVSVTETGSHDEEKGLIAYVLSGVDTATPIDVAGNNTSVTSDATNVLSAISPTSSDAFLITHVNTGSGLGGGHTYTWSGGSLTEQYDTGVGGLSMSGATEQLAASGSTGTRTATPTAPLSPWVGLMIAVETASAGGGTPVPNIRIVSAVQRLA